MSYALRRLFASQDTLVQLLFASAVGLLLGGALVLGSPRAVVVGLGALVGVIVIVKRPEFALLVMLVAYATVVDVDLVPLIPIGFGSLNVLDAALLGLLGLIVVRWLVEPDFYLRRTPVDVPLLIFYGACVLATGIALLNANVDRTFAVRELRYITYYITFFVVTNLVREKPQIDLLIRGFFLLAGVTAAIMIAQAVVGYGTPIVYGRVEQFVQDGQAVEGVARVIPAGRYLLLLAFNSYSLRLILDWRPKPLQIAFWILLLAALLLTFNRNFWIVSALVLALFAFLANRTERKKMGAFLLGCLVLFSAGFGALQLMGDRELGKAVSAAIVRVVSIFDSRTYRAQYRDDPANSSLAFRALENRYMLPQLSPPPLLGAGLGARYRPADPRLDWDQFDGREYIHNGHLWILFKVGLAGYLGLMLTMGLLIARGIRFWRMMPNTTYASVMIGFSLTAIGLLASANVDPLLADLAWAPVCAIALGLNEVLIATVKQGVVS